MKSAGIYAHTLAGELSGCLFPSKFMLMHICIIAN